MTLRDRIIKALGDKWTKELEDALFWEISEFLNVAMNHYRKSIIEGIREPLTKLLNELPTE